MTFCKEGLPYQVCGCCTVHACPCASQLYPALTDPFLLPTTTQIELDNKATNLSALSQKYKKDARYLNLRATYAKIAFGGVIALVVFLYFWVL